MRSAIITGVAGQDGSFLAEMLIREGYCVIGIPRPNDSGMEHIQSFKNNLILEPVDLTSESSINDLLNRYQPDELYNLAGDSFMPDFARVPLQTTEPNAIGPMRLLEGIRKISPHTRFFQASSSEMFGRSAISPQTETTPFAPLNLYAIAKVFAHSIAGYYRQYFNIFACSGILFNHESPRRKTTFVTRKITSTAARIKLGLTNELQLGNLDVKRDWGFAGDYVRAMSMMLRHQQADDYVIATGETHSVREFCQIAFAHLGLNYEQYVVQNPQFVRKEDYHAIGNPQKARSVLGWQPAVKLPELIAMMVEADMKILQSSR